MGTQGKIKSLLQKYTSNRINPDDFEMLRSSVNHLSDQDMESLLYEQWNETRFDYDVNYAKKIDQICYGIRQNTRSNTIWGWKDGLFRIAAVAAILLLTGFSLFLYVTNHKLSELGEKNVIVKVGKGERASISLPDGSHVRLNSESQLSYQQNFGLDNRTVSLSGEGYFEVKKNTGKTFFVNTRSLEIKVTGTSFNVYSYENNGYIEMALVEGCVNVTSKKPPFKSAIVHPNQKVVYNEKTGDLKVLSSSNLLETAWVSNELVFRSVPMKQVLERVSRRYGVKIEANDESFLKDTYTGVFDTEEIEDVMNIFKEHFGFTYQLKEDEIIIYTNVNSINLKKKSMKQK